MSDFYDLNKKLAGLDKVQLNESCESEQLDELSPKTLANYVRGASDDLEFKGWQQGNERNRPHDPDMDDYMLDRTLRRSEKIDQRKQGIDRALDRLTKEDQIDEISDKLADRVGNMRHDAVKSADRSNRDELMSKYNAFSKNQKLQHSRDIRQQKAGLKGRDPRSAEYQDAEPGRRNFGDSIESCDQQLDELSPQTLGSYVKKAAHEVGYAGGAERAAGERRDRATEREYGRHREKRERGIGKAIDKMVGHPVDESPQIGMFERDAPRKLSPHESALLKDKLARLQSKVGERPELAKDIARIKNLLSGKMMSESIVVGDIIMFETTPGFTSKARVVAVTEGQYKVKTASGTEYLVTEAEVKKAKKDYDKDGKIESPKDEVWGSRMSAAKKSGKMNEESEQERAEKRKQWRQGGMWDDVDDESLDAIIGDQRRKNAKPNPHRKSRDDNHDSFDESIGRKLADKDYDKDGKIESPKDEVIGSRRRAAGLDEEKPSAGLSKKQKSSVAKKAHAGKDIGKKGKGFDALAKKAGGGEKGKKIAAAAMWKNIKREDAGWDDEEDDYEWQERSDVLPQDGDQLDELSPKKLKSYMKKSNKDAMHVAGDALQAHDMKDYGREADSLSKLRNRLSGQKRAQSRLAGPRVVEEDQAMYALDDQLNALESALQSAVQEAKNFYKAARTSHPNIANQVKAYTLPWLMAWIDDPRQPGSIDSLRHNLHSGGEELEEKAVSKKQQKFMGMVHAAQKGEKPASKEVAKVAKSMKKKDAEDFASTKHKGLPEKKKAKKEESKGEEKKVKETASAGSTSSGSVATSDSSSSKGGMQYGKGVYEGVMESMEMKYNQLLNEGLKVTMNQNEDGSPSSGITIVADGPEAEELSRLLNLSGLEQDSCSCDDSEVVDENQPDWPTNPETSNDPFQYSGGLNKPKSTGQTTIPVIAGQTKRMGTMEESVELQRTLFNLYHIMGKGE